MGQGLRGMALSGVSRKLGQEHGQVFLLPSQAAEHDLDRGPGQQKEEQVP